MLRKTLVLGAAASVMLLTQPAYPAGMGASSGAAAGAGSGGGHSANVADPMRRTAAAYAAERVHSCRTPAGSRLWVTDPNCRPH